ncbi:unnamed protein product [Onchocerca flexuosa]|uniref:Sialin n=1 Tax=Onchocerca flexuosa TaxID=387005 RepID=A0A183HK96_9BILA|nr:unnamed protein product [Onchocerca flexuosa]
MGLEVLTRLADADGSQALSDHCHDAGTFACCLSALSRTPLIMRPGAGDTPVPTPCRRHAWPGRSVATAKHQPGLLLSLHPPPHASQSLGSQALATTPGEPTKFLGPVITMPMSGFLCSTSLGWPSVFYVHATITLIFLILWWILYRDQPDDVPWVSAYELSLINDGKTDNKAKRSNEKVCHYY